jgi:integrase
VHCRPPALARRRMGVRKTGRLPLNLNTDHHEWKALLDDARLRDGRLHDARHTAGTVLLLLQVPTPTAMSIMGWSSPAMTKRYQHVLDAIRKDVASQIGGLLWEGIEINPANSGDEDDGDDGGGLTVLLTSR